MSLEFYRSMDPHSLYIKRDGKQIGFLQWHTGRFKTVFWSDPGLTIWIEEWQQIQEKAQEVKNNWNTFTKPDPNYYR